MKNQLYNLHFFKESWKKREKFIKNVGRRGGNVRSGNLRLGKYAFGKLSFGKLTVRETSSGNCPSGKCPSEKCGSGNSPRTVSEN